MNEPLQITLADAIQLLEAQQILYALVGGMAVSVRGQPRATVDVDLVIAADVERALALAAVLDDTSFAPLFGNVSEVVERAFILPLRHRHTHVKVDLALGLSGFEKQALARAQRVELAGTTVSIATTEDLIVMKAFAGRPQDEQDLEALVVAQGKQLDWEYCLRVAAELGESVGHDLITRIRNLRR
ncbi:MAG: nucleotidyltransferase [Pirellulales bacterium]